MPDTDKVKISLYLIRGKRALLVIGNTSDQVVETKVKLDLAGLGLKQPGARNILTDQKLTVRGNSLAVRLRPNSFVLAQVQ